MPSAAKKLYVLQTSPVGRVLEIDPVTGQRNVIVDQLTEHPDGIIVDRTRNRVIWTNMGQINGPNQLDFFQADGSLVSTSLDGKEPVKPLVSAGLFVTGKQLAFDDVNRRFYWCDREGMRIFRCNEDGSNVQVLVKRGIFPKDSVDTTRHCVGIALDQRDKRLYWTQKGPPKGGKGRIFSVPYDMELDRYPLESQDIRLEMDDLPEPIDLEFSEDGHKIYWTDRGDASKGGNSLNVADFVHGRLKNHKIIAAGFDEAIGLTIDNDQGVIYVSDLGGSIYKHDLAVANSVSIVAEGLGNLTGIVLA